MLQGPADDAGERMADAGPVHRSSRGSRTAVPQPTPDGDVPEDKQVAIQHRPGRRHLFGRAQSVQGHAPVTDGLRLHRPGGERAGRRQDGLREVLPRLRSRPPGLLPGPSRRVLLHEQVHRAHRAR